MTRFKHNSLIIIAGSIWFTVGLMLMKLGIKFLLQAQSGNINFYKSSFSGDHITLFFICLALILGLLKGRTVLQKTAKKMIAHIKTLPEPAPIIQIYDKKFLVLIFVMMSLGMGMNFLKVPLDIRGAIDLTIGSALIHGSLFFFRNRKKHH